MQEWIEGTKLVNMEINEENQFDTSSIPDDDKLLKENLELIQQALYVTISQLLSTGVMHAGENESLFLSTLSSETNC